MTLPPRLSYIKLRNAQEIESAELVLDGGRYPIPKQGRGIFSRSFHEPLTFATGQLSLLVGRKKSRFGFSSQTVSESISICAAEIFSILERQRVRKKDNKVSLTLGFLSVTFGVSFQMNQIKPVVHTRMLLNDQSTSARAYPEGLWQATEDLIKRCPRFRILVIGKLGVGRFTLIKRVFGVETTNITDSPLPRAGVENELTSPQNDRLALHIFNAHEGYDKVEAFIEQKECMSDVKNQLHAVWLCFQIPILPYDERPLEEDARGLLRITKKILGNIATIFVFTKYDRLANHMRQENPGAEQQYLQEHCIQPIQDFTGDMDIAYVAVSSKPGYERGLEELKRLTLEQVSESFTGNTELAVLLALADAQRMSYTSKVDLLIHVGKQRYWGALGTSANFRGYTMEDCLRVIHTDIVAVWKFYDPCQYLNSEELRKAMINMVERVNASAASNLHPPRSDTLSRVAIPLIALASIVLPLNVCVTLGKWVYETYQRLQGVPTKFIAYIVDLTHVLEILFALTAGTRTKKLTRTVIKLAYKAYLESQWMRHTHTDIRFFECPSTARDVILEKITSMIASDYREVLVSRALETIPRVDLERDEDWGQEVF